MVLKLSTNQSPIHKFFYSMLFYLLTRGNFRPSYFYPSHGLVIHLDNLRTSKMVTSPFFLASTSPVSAWVDKKRTTLRSWKLTASIGPFLIVILSPFAILFDYILFGKMKINFVDIFGSSFC